MSGADVGEALERQFAEVRRRETRRLERTLVLFPTVPRFARDLALRRAFEPRRSGYCRRRHRGPGGRRRATAPLRPAGGCERVPVRRGSVHETATAHPPTDG